MKYLVQVDLARLEEIKRNLAVLRASSQVKPIEQVMDYLVIDVPPELAPKVEAITGVVRVTPERWLSIKQILIPIDKKIADFHRLFLSNPITGPASAFKFSLEADMGKERVPTSESRKMLGADVADAEGVTGKNIKVAVLDTGTNVLGVQGPYLGGASSVEGQPVQIDENGHGCVEPDAMLCLSNPGLCKISDFYNSITEQEQRTNIGFTKQLTKEIYTQSLCDNGQICHDKVLAAHRVPIRGEIVEITLLWGKTLKLTPWHPTPVIQNGKIRWKVASEVKIGDYIPYSLVPSGLGKYQKVTFLKRKEYMATNPVRHYSAVYRELVIDENLAWLIGYTIGDGSWVDSTEASITDEKSELLLKAKEIAEGYGFTCSLFEDRNQLSIYGFGRLMESLDCIIGDNKRNGGGKRYLRCIPKAILKSPHTVRAAFTAGIFDAEGRVSDIGHSYSNRQYWCLGFVRVCISISKELCAGIANLLDSIGVPSYVTLEYEEKGRESALYSTKINQKWNLRRFLETVGPHIQSFKREVIEKNIKYNRINQREVIFLNDIVGLKVRKITHTKLNDYFYDLTTENYNNYYASGAFIHNTHCQTTISGRPFQSIHGLLKGVAIDADVAAFKVLGYGIGAGTNTAVLRGMMDAFNWGASIISMSLGSPYTEEPPEVLPETRAIKMLTDQGIIVIVANGNNGPRAKSVGVPANSSQALSVGAVDINGNLASFSSRGPTAQGLVKPDCVGPGVNILSTSAGLIATMQFMDGPPLLACISGTSMSTPHVAGLVALALQYARIKGKKLTTEGIKKALEVYGNPKNNDSGWGLLTYQILRRYIDEKL